MIAELTIVKKFTTFEIENDFLYILLHRNTPTGNPSSGTNCGNRIGGRVRSYAVMCSHAGIGGLVGVAIGAIFWFLLSAIGAAGGIGRYFFFVWIGVCVLISLHQNWPAIVSRGIRARSDASDDS